MGDEIDVDNIIEQLLGVRGARPGRQVNLTENEIRWLCVRGREVFTSQPVLLELEAPIKICGPSLLSLSLCALYFSFFFFFFLLFLTSRVFL